jgi:hypothetical protein
MKQKTGIISSVQWAERIVKLIRSVECGTAIAALKIAQSIVEERAKVYSSHLPYLGG